MDRFLRTKMIIGEEGYEKLKGSNVAVCGIGGVGSYVVEALARAGVGKFLLIDHDVIDITNINRQIHALDSTVGLKKTKAMQERIKGINPYAVVNTCNDFLSLDNIDMLTDGIDFIVDALDTVSTKIAMAELAYANKINLISAMGMANKMRPEMIEIGDINKTSVCPLARVVRMELKKRNIPRLCVCFSKETPVKLQNIKTEERRVLGSVSFVPSAAGLLIASHVVNRLVDFRYPKP